MTRWTLGAILLVLCIAMPGRSQEIPLTTPPWPDDPVEPVWPGEPADQVEQVESKALWWTTSSEALATWQAKCGRIPRCEPVWSFTAGAVVLKRERTNHSPLLAEIDLNNALLAPGPTQVDASVLDTDYELGYELAASRRLANDAEIEFRFFAVEAGEATHDTVTTGSVMVLAPPYPFTLTDSTHALSLRSRLYSFEINARCPVTRRLSLVAGFRAAELAEQLHNRQEALSGIRSFDWDWNVNNHLYGFQLGADARLFRPTSRLGIDASIRSGVYGNASDVDFTYIDHEFSIFSSSGRGKRGSVAFLGELSLLATYDLGRKWSLYAGYEALWLTGVAVGTEQVDGTNFALGGDATVSVHAAGDVFYHGVTAGISFRH